MQSGNWSQAATAGSTPAPPGLPLPFPGPQPKPFPGCICPKHTAWDVVRPGFQKTTSWECCLPLATRMQGLRLAGLHPQVLRLMFSSVGYKEQRSPRGSTAPPEMARGRLEEKEREGEGKGERTYQSRYTRPSIVHSGSSCPQIHTCIETASPGFNWWVPPTTE